MRNRNKRYASSIVVHNRNYRYAIWRECACNHRLEFSACRPFWSMIPYRCKWQWTNLFQTRLWEIGDGVLNGKESGQPSCAEYVHSPSTIPLPLAIFLAEIIGEISSNSISPFCLQPMVRHNDEVPIILAISQNHGRLCNSNEAANLQCTNVTVTCQWFTLPSQCGPFYEHGYKSGTNCYQLIVKLAIRNNFNKISIKTHIFFPFENGVRKMFAILFEGTFY